LKYSEKDDIKNSITFDDTKLFNMEEDKYGFSHEEEIKQVINKFEMMKKNNENYFFDVI
jgi:hypothetical protein